jgi:hypothetical protein
MKSIKRGNRSWHFCKQPVSRKFGEGVRSLRK